MMLHMAASNTLIQTIVEEDKRGRVMSLYAMAFLGVGPLGSLVGGVLAARMGAPETVRVAGCFSIAGALVFGWHLPHLRNLVRPIYEQAGILPKPVPLPSAVVAPVATPIDS
jgi:MFS family permease